MKINFNEMSERDKNILTIVVVIILFIAVLIYNLVDKTLEAKRLQEESMKTVLVTDDSRYMTVINCIQKYLTTVQNESAENILLLLNDEYKTEYNINANNYKNFVPVLNANNIYDYVGAEMYQHRVSSSVVEFYVKGQIKGSRLNENPSFVENDITVVLYEKEFTFSIKPGIEGLEI